MRRNIQLPFVGLVVFCVLASALLAISLYSHNVFAQSAGTGSGSDSPNQLTHQLTINGVTIDKDLNDNGTASVGITNGVVVIRGGLNEDGSFNDGTEVNLTITPELMSHQIKFDGRQFDGVLAEYEPFGKVVYGNNTYVATLSMDGDISVAIDIQEPTPVGFNISSPEMTIDKEGGTSKFSVVLNIQPTSKEEVWVKITPEQSDILTVSPDILVFREADWSRHQEVVVTNVGRLDGNTSVNIYVIKDKSDPKYSSAADRSVLVTTSINQLAGFNLSDDKVTISEQRGNNRFTVSLDAQPTSDVTLLVESKNPNRISVSPETLIFNHMNWDQGQVVTVTDVGSQGEEEISVIVSVDESKSDSAYHAVNEETLVVTTSYGIGGGGDNPDDKDKWDLFLKTDPEEPSPGGIDGQESKYVIDYSLWIEGKSLEDFFISLQDDVPEERIKWSNLTMQVWSEEYGSISEKVGIPKPSAAGPQNQRITITLPSDAVATPHTRMDLQFHLGVLTSVTNVRILNEGISRGKVNFTGFVEGFSYDEVLSAYLTKKDEAGNSEGFPANLATGRNLIGLIAIVWIIIIGLFVLKYPRVLKPFGAIFHSSRLDVQRVLEEVRGLENSLYRIETNSRSQPPDLVGRGRPESRTSDSSQELQRQNTGLLRERNRAIEERDKTNEVLRSREAEFRNAANVQSRLDEVSGERDRLLERNEVLQEDIRQARNEETILPRLLQERIELSEKVRLLGGSLNDVVSELVAEYEITDPGAELNQRYWAVEDRLRLLREVLDQLLVEEKERAEQEAQRGRNLDRIARNIQNLESLNIRRGLDNIKALAEGAGTESSDVIASILDDMIASVPPREISAEVLAEIDEYSAHVDGLGINTRFIPRALVEICRDLAANAPPEEAEYIEAMIRRVIEAARSRF